MRSLGTEPLKIPFRYEENSNTWTFNPHHSCKERAPASPGLPLCTQLLFNLTTYPSDVTILVTGTPAFFTSPRLTLYKSITWRKHHENYHQRRGRCALPVRRKTWNDCRFSRSWDRSCISILTQTPIPFLPVAHSPLPGILCQLNGDILCNYRGRSGIPCLRGYSSCRNHPVS